MKDLDKIGQGSVPMHLRDASHSGSKKMGYGEGYLYPHDFPGHWVKQEYLPAELRGRRYYYPSTEGYEQEIREHMEKRQTSKN